MASIQQVSGRYLDEQLVILDRARPSFAGDHSLDGRFALSGIEHRLHEQPKGFRVFFRWVGKLPFGKFHPQRCEGGIEWQLVALSVFNVGQ
ncbi:hypothetical protein D3C79_969350 [compost metagenome]